MEVGRWGGHLTTVHGSGVHVLTPTRVIPLTPGSGGR